MKKNNTLTTHGIKISVSSRYEKEASNPTLNRYIHSYFISIENQSKKNVQLLSRYWLITDGDGSKREVKGEGVVGEQPMLYPGDTHSYNSWSPLSFPAGKMAGHYIMKDLDTGELFQVDIPEFKLVASFKEN